MEWVTLVLVLLEVFGPYISKWLAELFAKTSDKLDTLVQEKLLLAPMEYEDPVEMEKKFWDTAELVMEEEMRETNFLSFYTRWITNPARRGAFKRVRDAAQADRRKGKFFEAAYLSGVGKINAAKVPPLTSNEKLRIGESQLNN